MLIKTLTEEIQSVVLEEITLSFENCTIHMVVLEETTLSFQNLTIHMFVWARGDIGTAKRRDRVKNFSDV